MPKIYDLIDQQRKEIVKSFNLSRTGAEMDTSNFPNHERLIQYKTNFNKLLQSAIESIDLLNQDEMTMEIDRYQQCLTQVLERGMDPEIFAEHQDKQMFMFTLFNYYDDTGIEYRKGSVSVSDYHEKIKSLSYANCTVQASLLADRLNEIGIESRVFSLGSSHDFVVSRNEEGNVVLSDPWADIQLVVNLPDKISHIDELRNNGQADNVRTIIQSISSQFSCWQDFPTECAHLIDHDKLRNSAFPIQQPIACLPEIEENKLLIEKEKQQQDTPKLFNNHQPKPNQKQICVVM
ncbi:MAG: hypothetical protein EP298_05750 [Gammaproteobacteria bacterium]|nr:MAG: hypothetical protein EP298_05750 [Gammaproteobacteria bacterium]UTW41440.1 hypothetical protein KFE69_07920 [bacterium SCSIO 12844]